MGKKMTSDEIKAHLTLEEIERIGSDREQMTYTTTQFIESLVEERIQKAALLAACKKHSERMIKWLTIERFKSATITDLKRLMVDFVDDAQSAIEQAGEGV